jgi:hypothetical protein
MIFRSEQQKRDLESAWLRPDRPFFASGACHILASSFLDTYPESGFAAFHVCPREGFRGGHMFVSNGRRVFDYHGYSDQSPFIAHFISKMQRFFPGWTGDIIRIDGPITDPGFCRRFTLRLPSQFPHDPLPRAVRFIRRFPRP